MICLEAQSLKKHYLSKERHFWQKKVSYLAIDNLSLSLGEGEIYAFLWPNGAGKTTLMKLMLGLIQPDQGSVKFQWKKIQNLWSDIKHIGYAPDQVLYYPQFTGLQHLVSIGILWGIDLNIMKKKALVLLEKLGLLYAADKQVIAYSQGMKQRLGLSISLINDPLLLFWDEPMNGLDPLGRNLIKNLMLDLKSQGKTIFFNTHILSDVSQIADRVGILSQGKLVFESRVKDLKWDIQTIFDQVVKTDRKHII